MTPEKFLQQSESGPEGKLGDDIKKIHERNTLVEKKMGAQVHSFDATVATLPQEERAPYLERARGLFGKARDSLSTVTATATVALALSTPALAQEHQTEDVTSQEANLTVTPENARTIATALLEVIQEKARQTGEDLTTVVSPDATPGQRIDASLNVLTKPPIVGAYVEKHIPALSVIDALNKIRNDIALKEKLDKDDPELKKTSIGKFEQRIKIIANETSTKQETVDAILDVATDTTVISSVILRKFPIVALFYQANQLVKDLQNPKITAGEATKKLGLAILAVKTFGLSDVIFKTLSPEPTKIAEAQEER